MLDVALKEWSIVCDLLVEGELAIVLRKGGIHESGGPGVFELEHDRFALFPSWAHQKPEMIKAGYRDRVEVFDDEPDELTIKGVAEAGGIWVIPSREAFDQLDDLHCWTREQIDMRFNYKPERPLYLVALRVERLAKPVTIANDAEYAGCRSWVPLRPGDALDDAGAVPVMGDSVWDALMRRVDGVLGTRGMAGD